MSMRRLYLVTVALCVATPSTTLADNDLPRHNVPSSPTGDLVVGLCDGETSMEVPGIKAGETMSREQAQQVADGLMSEWRRKHPGAEWVTAPSVSATRAQDGEPSEIVAQNAPVNEPKAAAQTEQFQTYGAFTDRDRQIWRASTEQLVAEGKRIFHDAKALGGTDGISCDMCHPDAANTHPETYPKFQVQLGRVALLRDMINWCIENPVRGKPFADDDPRLKALEAYIIAQRRGVPLDYGKH
jgi:thiosulfate dehydrogenase